MPKPRNTERKQVAFQVSPWNSVKSSTTSPSETATYEEVTVPLARQQSKPASSGAVVTSSARPAAAETAIPADQHAQWRTTKKQRVDADVSVRPVESTQVSAEEPDVAFPEGLYVVEGPAVLAVLSTGGIAGHLVDLKNRKAYGVRARVLHRRYDCTTEEDWLLLMVTLMDFQSHDEEHAIAEKTGGDMLRLQPMSGLPVHVQRAVEAEVLDMDNLGSVEFSCDELYADEKAQELLAAYQPKLMGQDVIVNKGWMKWTCSSY